MKYIVIPFKKMFWLKMADGIKTATSRTKKYGEAGDRFWRGDYEYQLTSVELESLRYIANMLWEEEGCDSREHFINIWESIHPQKGFDPLQKVYLHRFMRVK